MAEIKQSKHPAIEIYTDGSKDENKGNATAVINHYVFSVRLPNEATILTAEAKAIRKFRDTCSSVMGEFYCPRTHIGGYKP